MSFGDAVAVTADKGGAVRLGGVNDVLDVVVTLNDVGHVPVLVGHHDGNNCASVIRDGYFIPLTVFQDVQIRILSV